MPPIYVLVNNASGPSQRRAARDRALRQALGRADRAYFTTDLHDLDRAAIDIASRPPGTIAICGGDGTVGAVCNALYRRFDRRPLPPLALLRGGTMNTIANGLGVPAAPPHTRLNSIQSPGHRRTRPTTTCTALNVNGRLGFLLSCGVMYGFLAAYYRAGRGEPNLSTALTTLLRAMGSAAVGGPFARAIAHRFQADIAVDGVAQVGAESYLVVGAGTVPQVGLGFRPFARGAQTAGHFHSIAFPGTTAQLLLALPAFASGQGHRVPTALDTPSRHLRLTATRPLPYALDGDLFDAVTRLDVHAGPELTFLL